MVGFRVYFAKQMGVRRVVILSDSESRVTLNVTSC